MPGLHASDRGVRGSCQSHSLRSTPSARSAVSHSSAPSARISNAHVEVWSAFRPEGCYDKHQTTVAHREEATMLLRVLPVLAILAVSPAFADDKEKPGVSLTDEEKTIFELTNKARAKEK